MKKYSYLKSPLFKKYVSSYLAFFLLTLLFFSLYLYNTTIRELKGEIEESNSAQLIQAEIMITNQLRDVTSIADRMGMDPELIPYKVRNNQYTSQTMNEIKDYKESHSWIDEIFLYYGDDVLYSSKGTIYLNMLSSYSPYFEKLTPPELEEELKSSALKIVPIHYRHRSSDAPPNRYAYFTPLRRGASDQHGKIVFILDNQEVTKILNSIPNASTFIMDNNHMILSHSSNWEGMALEDLNAIAQETSSKPNNKITYNGSGYMVSSAFSPYLGWNFISLIQTELFYQNIHKAYFSFFLFLFALIIIGVVLSIVLSMYHYLPLQKLYSFLNKEKGNEYHYDVDGADEIELLNNIVAGIVSENENLQHEISTKKNLIRNNIFAQLLEGNISTERMEGLIKGYGLSFTYDTYLICSTQRTNHSAENWSVEVYQQIIEKYCDWNYDFFQVNALYLDYKDQLVFFISCADDISAAPSKSDLIKLIESIQGDIQYMYGLQFHFGIGSVNQDVDKMKQSYIESIAALDVARQQNNMLNFFSQITGPKQQDSAQAYKNLALLFEKSLNEGEGEVARGALASIRTLLVDSNFTSSQLKFFSFELIHIAIQSGVEHNLFSTEEDLEKMMNSSTIHHLLDFLLEYTEVIGSQYEQDKQTSQAGVAKEMVRYIENNFLSSSLSLEEISSIFNFSVSYTSRIIKEYQGVSFNHYLQDLRMEEFKKKLVHTNLPIKDLVFEVGYLDVSNFTRKFKSHTGFTPTQYRKENQKPAKH